ncbi:molybdenum cofactor biosynthesis protein MoaA [Haloprofundus marisrubri]|uniref:Molybdenum cofactor biosynthesis protein MoaA n=1 Tax=Haloprofundus marisrubri TaxID=1514971 RepID=A0A0W1R820_9EURY|nr:gephyrin-like molybdotransferase Glp [Haloprofundus marisrubri]KTG09393.1 molybdenum cofactor biosynthesis protein MoaA [Haloprofundus marisrubri]
MSHDDLRRAGFKDRTRVADARERLLAAVTPHERTERVALEAADGRALAETVTAARDVPGYDRAAMDGYAVQAKDTFGASGRSPSVLRLAEAKKTESADERDVAPQVNPGEAVRVHTGSELPDGADAVVMVEQTEEIGDEVEVFDALAEGENVGDADEDVADGQSLYDAGHRLRPSDLGLLKSVGVHEAETYERPRIAVIPTGEELVQRDPEPGEVVETNGLTVSKLVERWGGDASYRDVVTDDEEALREAIESNLDHDVVVTTGGSSVGERDLTYEVVDELGEVFVHGVALKPGHPVALGEVDDTAVVMLPGYPVACVINAVQFLRPALKRAGHLPDDPFPTREATLTRKVPSEPGIRTFARVRTEASENGEELEATPTRASGSGILSSVALADGWVVVPEEREGLEAGATVAVENWEWSA